MFFARVPILVEGLEDVAYITTELHLTEGWSEFRRLGCHLIPVNGKCNLIKPLAIAIELGLPVFVIFDADGDNQRADQRTKHERDNRALLALLQSSEAPFPSGNVFGTNHAVWPTNFGEVVKADFGDAYEGLANAARVEYAHEGNLEKNELFIAEWVSAGHQAGISSTTLQHLCKAILDYARAA